MVLYNETSGSSESKEIAERFKKAAEARGEAVILQPSNPDIDPEEMRKNAKENQVGVLVVIGGDGTIHHAVQNFKDTIRDYQIGIIPGGTVNNFARVLSIPLKEEDAFETILAGQTTPVDFGMVNQDVMISTLTIGLLADTAANVTQQEKQKYDPLAFTKQFPINDEIKDLVMNASIIIEGTYVMISDVPDMFGFEVTEGNNLSLVVSTDDDEKIEIAGNFQSI